MDRRAFLRLEQAFEQARELPAAARQPVLDALGQEDGELRRRLEQLLADHDAHGGDSLLQAGRALRADLGDAEPAAPPLPDRVGRFRILGEIARGGIGRVLRAEDPVIGREVALKLLRPEFLGRADAHELIAEEGRLGGQLQHPSIVPVYEIGTTDSGEPYLAMKVIEGRDLASLLAARAEPGDNLARFVGVFEQICQAMAYAHGCGVVHRDLKPHNVMVGAFGEVQVMDWGIAMRLQPAAAAARPAERAVSGTPAYMAPEQARGESARIDRRTDVFGLGAMLCEILTGAPPYAGGSAAQVLACARAADLGAAAARLHDCRDEADLAQLALLCLAADPAARPADAAAVAAAVRQHIESAAARLRRAELDARTATTRAEAERKVRRLIVALAAVVVVAAVGGAWAWIDTQDAARQRSTLAQQRLTDALLTAERRAATAEADGGDQRNWDAALQAAAAARSLVDATSPPELAQRAVSLHGQVEVDAEDLRFVRGLQAAGSEVSCTNRFDRRPMAREMRSQLERRIGGAFDVVPTEDTLRTLTAIRWRDPLVNALDAWLRLELERDPTAEIAPRIRAVADALDEDAWRREVRAAIAARGIERLRELAREPLVAKAAPSTLRQLALGLMARGDYGAGLDLLRSSVALHPGDFESLIDLGWFLISAHTLVAVEEAQRYVQAALAAQPGHPAALELQANLFSLRGRHPEALATIDQAIATATDGTNYRATRARLRRLSGDLDGAAEDYEDALLRVDRNHGAWGVMTLELARVRLRQDRVDDAWAQFVAGIKSGAPLLEDLLESVELRDPRLLAVARQHTADPEAWPAWLQIGIALDETEPAAALQALERIARAPAWCMRYAARRIVELREDIGEAAPSFGAAETAIAALPQDLDFAASRRRFEVALEALRRDGQAAIAEYLEGLLCERAARTEAALAHYRAAIAADRDAIEAWARLHACRAQSDGIAAADAEIAALLADRPPGPILRLPLRTPELRVEAGARGPLLVWSVQQPLDPRAPALATELRITAADAGDARQAAVALAFIDGRDRYEPVPGLLTAREYRAVVRSLRDGDAGEGPWSPPAALTIASGTPVVVDLSPHFTADVVAAPGDDDDDAFDAKNGYRLTVDGFDGERDGVAAAQGLPRDGRLGPFRLGPYDRPQSIAFGPGQRAVVRIELPPDRYLALHVLASAANGNYLLPFAVGYEGETPGEVAGRLFLADWFFAGRPPELDQKHIGMPVLTGMDRVGRRGFENRDAAVLLDKVILLDPTRVARWLLFLPEKAGYADQGSLAHVFAVTAIRPAEPQGGR